MDGGKSPTPIEVAQVAGGGRAATRVAFIMLYRRKLVTPDGRGRLTRSGGANRTGGSLERALFNGLLGTVAPAEVLLQPKVRRELTDLRQRLEGDGLLRPWWARIAFPLVLLTLPPYAVARTGLPPLAAIPVVLAGVAAAAFFVPRRRPAGARLLRRLRAEHAALATAEDLDPDEAGLAAALFGRRVMAAVAGPAWLGGGLAGGGRWSREARQNSATYGQWTAEAMGQIDHQNPTSPF
ncbi:hypothetical protein GCM10010170_109290 [Dactylosporangium salmoneum]|uniref:TIGR04222 domain-containing membrane protein n=2 Tax=Dactylosporangium salmoneum TaxID=53361 RepID=A0ABP5V6A2_9ACTN